MAPAARLSYMENGEMRGDPPLDRYVKSEEKVWCCSESWLEMHVGTSTWVAMAVCECATRKAMWPRKRNRSNLRQSLSLSLSLSLALSLSLVAHCRCRGSLGCCSRFWSWGLGISDFGSWAHDHSFDDHGFSSPPLASNGQCLRMSALQYLGVL